MNSRLGDRIATARAELDRVRASLLHQGSAADIRPVLAWCEGELDEALGILVVSAVRLLSAHVTLLLGAT